MERIVCGKYVYFIWWLFYGYCWYGIVWWLWRIFFNIGLWIVLWKLVYKRGKMFFWWNVGNNLFFNKRECRNLKLWKEKFL